MIQPHIIALDLDGTLLTNSKIITDRTKKTLQLAREKGHHIVISTGRVLRGSQMYYDELQLDSPIIAYNGSYISHPKDDSFEEIHSTLDIELVKSIIQLAHENDIKDIYADHITDVYAYEMRHPIDRMLFIRNGNFIEGPLLETLKISPTSLLISTENGRDQEVRTLLDKHYNGKFECKSYGDPLELIELSSLGITKAFGLEKVASYYGIPSERIIAFGDEDNDIEMLKYAGYGIAMGNSKEHIKSIADDVTLTNEEEGVAVFLERFLDL